MQTISASLLHMVVLCLLLPGTAFNAHHLHNSFGGHEQGRGQHPATVLPRRARHHQPARRPPRCQNSVAMMPPDDEKGALCVRRAKLLVYAICLADREGVSRALAPSSLSRAVDPPLYQSLCVLLI